MFTCIKSSCAETWRAMFCSLDLCFHSALVPSSPSHPQTKSSRPPRPPPHSHWRSSVRTHCRAAPGRPRVSRARRATLWRWRTARERDPLARSLVNPLCCRGRSHAPPTPLPATNGYMEYSGLYFK